MTAPSETAFELDSRSIFESLRCQAGDSRSIINYREVAGL